MQIESMRVIPHRSWKVDDVSGPEARERLWRLEQFDKMRADGCSEALSLEMIGWSRATYYRWRNRLRPIQQGSFHKPTKQLHGESSGSVTKYGAVNHAYLKRKQAEIHLTLYGIQNFADTMGAGMLFFGISGESGKRV